MLIRSGAGGLEILFLRRNPTLAFHGGYWVFPGGRIDAGDVDPIAPDDQAAAARRAAVREAREGGGEAWAFGMNRNQNDVAPDVIVGSAVIDIPAMFLRTARAWDAGTLSADVLYSGIAAGAVDFVANPAQDGVIPDDVLAAIDRARDEIVAGTLEVPRIEFVEGAEGAGADPGARGDPLPS